ncbi:MAG: hypothetical protein ACT4OJ_15055 [Bacteroidota bacterium]
MNKYKKYFIHLFILPVFLIEAFSVVAQTCPSGFGEHYKLVYTDEKPSGKITYTEKDGVKIGSMACHYEAHPTWMKSGVQLTWVEETPQLSGRAILEMTCYPFASPATFSSATKQVRASITGWGNEEHRKELAEIALKLLKETEPIALPCPGVVQDEIERNNNRSKAAKAKLIRTDGWVEIYDPATKKWVHHVTGTESLILAGQKVATRSDARATIVIINSEGEEEYVELGGNTIFAVSTEGQPGFFNTVFGLLKGVLRYFHKSNSVVIKKLPRFQTPTIIIEPEGTEFIVYHDSVAKSDKVLVKGGKLTLTAGGIKKVLTDGLQVTVRNGNISAPSVMSNDLWKSYSGQTGAKGKNIRPSELAIPEKY